MSSPKEIPSDIETLCDLCRNLALKVQEAVRDKEWEEKFIPHHSNEEELSKSAETCPFCWSFKAAVNGKQGWNQDSDICHLYLAIKFYAKVNGTRIYIFNCGYECFHGQSKLMVQAPSAIIIYGSEVRFQKVILRIQQWLETCTSQPLYHKAMKSRPSRLVDVGKAGPVILPKIVNANKIPENKFQYFALSHCWGNPKLLPKLTSETIATFEKAIPFEILSKTFQDAIRVTRALGCHYLWIDALCIMQDDPLDWQSESAKMINIYEQCHLLLAATSSSDSSGGLFLDASAKPAQHGDKRTVGKLSSVYSTAGTVAVLYDESAQRRRASKLLRSAPLHRRGWTLQENMLAPRSVHFTEEQVFWECYEYIESEDGLIGSDTNTSTYGIALKSCRWKNIVSDYSQRSFTFPADRPVAIAGLIHSFEFLQQDEPVLGLWHRTFHKDICWKNAGQLSALTRIPESSFPSWSWLSVEGEVTACSAESSEEKEETLLLKSFKIEWSSFPYTSKLLKAELVLKGPTIRLPDTFLDLSSIVSLKSGSLTGVFPKIESQFSMDLPLSSEDLKNVVLLGAFTISLLEVCLVLIPDLEQSRLVYRRVGVVEFYHKSKGTFLFTGMAKETIELV